MKGHIRERSPHHFAIILDVRDPSTGKRKRRWHSFRGTKREAQIECARLVSEISGGTYVDPTKLTMAAFFDSWLAHMKTQLSPRAYERYSEICTKNLTPLLGGVLLPKLRPAAISAAYSKALSEGRRDGKGGLSPSTVIYLHRILKHALKQAVRWQLIPINPAESVDPPRVESGRMQTYDIAQTADLLEALRGSRLFMPVLLAVCCGLRRGEIAALRWGRLDGSQLSISESAEQTKAGIRYKPPKSGRGRTVALSAFVVEELRRHRVAQAQELLRVGIRQTEDMFIVAQADSQPLQPRSLTHAWEQFIAGTKLPRIRFHDLRHAHATHLLASGVHPKVASERLGHSKVGITLDLYSHVLPGMQEDAAARVDDALQAALKRRAG